VSFAKAMPERIDNY